MNGALVSEAPSGGRAGGLTLEQHAGIAVALAEGFARAEVLAQEGVTVAIFRRADIAWKKRLANDVRQGGALFASYREKRAFAENWLRREVEPLDTDLGAWLGFCKAWSAEPEAFELLARWNLTVADVARIGRAWEAALASDPRLRTRAAELSPTARAPECVRVAPPKLRPFPWSRPAAAEACNAPAMRPEVAPKIEVAPPIVVVPVVPSYLREEARRVAPPQPAPSKLPDATIHEAPETAPMRQVNATLDAFVVPPRKTLPFAPAPPFEPRAAATPPDPPAAGSRGAFGTTVVFDLKQVLAASRARAPAMPSATLTLGDHAAMTAELLLRPERAPEVLRLAGLDAAAKAWHDLHFAALRRSSPEANGAWEQAYRVARATLIVAPWPGPGR